MAFGNMGETLKVMGAWNKFKANHPKFPAFLQAVGKRGFKEDMVIEVIITEPDGERLETSIKVQQSDVELLNELKTMAANRQQ
ncbi:MAG: hypothetical protein MJ124_00525 [Lachnospiraceae bacterium]|nr:hypothetical protein [Lachnospiraceae bacterium]